MIVKLIGQGGFAEVYLALQLPELMECAFKLMRRNLRTHPYAQSLIRKFRQEAETLASLNHPNIVRLIRSGTLDGDPFIIMEYARGVSLKDEIELRARENRPFSRQTVLTIFDQVCNGLQAAHDLNVVHRDIKPDNILLQPVSGHPLLIRLVDFGLARFVEGTTNTQALFGTPKYMAPELIGKSKVSLAFDTFSLGALLFEVLLLKPLFVGDTLQHILRRSLESPLSQVNLDTVEGLDPAQRIFLGKALMTEPRDRFQTAEEFRRGLHLAMEDSDKPLADVADDPVSIGIDREIWVEKTLTSAEFTSQGSGWGYLVAGLGSLLLSIGLGALMLAQPSPPTAPGEYRDSSTFGDADLHFATDANLADWRHRPDVGLVVAPPVQPYRELGLAEPVDVLMAPEVKALADGLAPALTPTVEDAQGGPLPGDVYLLHTDVPVVLDGTDRRGDATPIDTVREPVRSPVRNAGRIRHHPQRTQRYPMPSIEEPDRAQAPTQPILFEVMVDSVQADVTVLEGTRLLGRTPLSVTVLGDRPRKVILRKEGYKDHELTLTGARSAFRVDLQMAMW